MEDVAKFLSDVLAEIEIIDPKHARTLMSSHYETADWNLYKELTSLVYEFFKKRGIDAKQAASDYHKMIVDMRGEMIYFILKESYSCKKQHEAYEKVYSQPEVMSYYMNALTLSQILWRQHFKMLEYYQKTLSQLCESMRMRDFNVLDVGAGHGLYSYFAKKQLPTKQIDIVDVSTEALNMTKQMIGDEKIRYIHKDIEYFGLPDTYDLIIMGEILEHLDSPDQAMAGAREMLVEDGVLWITVPTNAPAIDHVYLFRSRNEVINMVKRTGFDVIDYYDITIEGNTALIGLFCTKK